MRSPVFSEDESSDNSLWIDLGQSPLESDYNGQRSKQKGSSPLPPFWFSGRNKNKQISPRRSSKISDSPIYNKEPHDAHMLSFDAAVRSVSEEVDYVKKIPEEEHYAETSPEQRFGNHKDHRHVHEIEEEHESSNPAHLLNSSNLYDGSSAYRQGISGNGIASGNGPEAKESAIRRETEGEFRLLGIEEGRKQIFYDRKGRLNNHSERGEFSATSLDDEEYMSDEYADDQDSGR
ncbi:hypothetical protein POM88_039470 [Heracleum sosnowskyi]|uniref:Uncharacterized protein n=1 Tax=Heracleum sosnowskyi TaxID=360622 RepID=A0AAD8HB94_9APIA|nr:hypothetical protein POM88_039470 [Heracleum sosnowskyi]